MRKLAKLQEQKQVRSGMSEEQFHKLNDPLPYFPDDILVRIFSNLISIYDARKARLVCRRWEKVIDDNADVLWENRCKVLGLLPETSWGVVHASAQRVRERVQELKSGREDENEASLTMRIAKIYEAHYFEWAHHLCRCDGFEPYRLTTLCKECTHPVKCDWIPCWALKKLRPILSSRLRISKLVYSPPPYLFVFRRKMARVDDLIHIVADMSGVEEALKILNQVRDHRHCVERSFPCKDLAMEIRIEYGPGLLDLRYGDTSDEESLPNGFFGGEEWTSLNFFGDDLS